MPILIAVLTLFAALMAAKADAETEPAEITIHIRGEHKEVVSALLEAADEGTPVTGIAELDSLAAIYGLMGIYRTNRRSSGFYGYRFRLTFPPGADVAAMAKAYRNLPYIQSVAGEAEKPPVPLWPRIRSIGGGERATSRIFVKICVGSVSSVASSGALLLLLLPREGESSTFSAALLYSVYFGPLVGFPLGVSLADPHDSLPMTLLGSVIPPLVGISLIKYGSESIRKLGITTMLVGPFIGSLYASEKWRKPPQDRVAFALAPTPNGGLSAVATLRF